MNCKACGILNDVLEAMQRAEELGGPSGDGYIRLMAKIAKEANDRILNFLSMRQTAAAQSSRIHEESHEFTKNHGHDFRCSQKNVVIDFVTDDDGTGYRCLECGGHFTEKDKTHEDLGSVECADCGAPAGGECFPSCPQVTDSDSSRRQK